MNEALFDLYSDYLISAFSYTTATGFSELTNGQISHDQITRLLTSPELTEKDWWRKVKPSVRLMQSETATLSIDDCIYEKPSMAENDIICWHYDHSKGRAVKGVNFVTALYQSNQAALPLAYRVIEKTEQYIDKKGVSKRRSPKTKNEHYREMLCQADQNQVPFKYVLNDIWFASVENMRFVKETLKRHFIMALKSNRKVALSKDDKQNGKYQRLSDLDLPETETVCIYLEGLAFPVHVWKQVFKNEDGSVGVRYLVTSDLSLSTAKLATLFKKRWKVEEYHRSLKQNLSLSKSPARMATTQRNHIAACLWSFIKLETLSKNYRKNHYALKQQLYLGALQKAFSNLRELSSQLPAYLSA